MDASCKFTEEETTLDMNVKAALEGGSYPTQNGTLTITTTDGTDTIVAGLTKNGEYTDASYHSRLDGQIEYLSLIHILWITCMKRKFYQKI